MFALASCGQKAAPDIDPPPSNNAAALPPTTTAAPTTTTADPGPLPQTERTPDSTTAAIRARMETLWQAIAANEPSNALPA